MITMEKRYHEHSRLSRLPIVQMCGYLQVLSEAVDSCEQFVHPRHCPSIAALPILVFVTRVALYAAPDCS
jgi:hypothetical protein